ncbi:MAG: flippase-like domain-containing protein [Rhodospirillaceae bacterium]|nr:flippase-like domain-containing protein [Rhodospirillaceae bacterium]
MRIFKLLTLIGGVAIFAWILSHADMASVAGVMGRLGIMGAGAILLTFGVAMASDVIGWALMFRSVPLSGLWTLRLWLVQMVGEAFNLLTPFGAFGGEPFKALLLNRHYDISYEESTATLILIQTVNSLAQVPFVILGTILMLNADILPEPIEQAILITTIVISVFMVLVYIALHGRLLAKLPAKMENSESGARLARAIAFLTDLEERLFHFVRNTPGRSAAALGFAFLSWVLGAVEIYFVFWFLDAPITFADAWIVETAIVLVRSITFFVPGHIGVQDGALMAVVAALTGSNETGVAMALIRRGRELFWAGIGLLIYGGFNLRDRKPA